jgi:DNA-binding IclR family transcriptional regulator
VPPTTEPGGTWNEGWDVAKGSGNAARYGVPPVARAIRLLRQIADGDRVLNASRTGKALGINRTTLIRLLHTLEEERFIERRPDGEGYQIGAGVIGLAAQSLFSQDLLQTALPILSGLAETFRLSSHLGVLDGRHVLYLLRRTPNVHLASNIRIGSRLPAHATAMGRIMLAFLPPEQVKALYGRAHLEAYSDTTPVNFAALRAQLDDDRKRAVVWSESGFEVGISAFAAPVFDHTGSVLAAINVTGPGEAFPTKGGQRARIGEAVRAAALQISERLGFVRSVSVR